MVQFRTRFPKLDRFECFHLNCPTSLLWTCVAFKLYRYVVLSFLFLMVYYLVSHVLMGLRPVPPQASGPISATLPCLFEFLHFFFTVFAALSQNLSDTTCKYFPPKFSAIFFIMKFRIWQGRHCSRCMFNQHCRGCVISPDSHISLRTDDTLAVTFAEAVSEVREVRHSSMTFQRAHKTLSLYDCVQAFSQR